MRRREPWAVVNWSIVHLKGASPYITWCNHIQESMPIIKKTKSTGKINANSNPFQLKQLQLMDASNISYIQAREEREREAPAACACWSDQRRKIGIWGCASEVETWKVWQTAGVSYYYRLGFSFFLSSFFFILVVRKMCVQLKKCQRSK